MAVLHRLLRSGKSIDRTSFDWYGAANLCKLMVGKEIARRLEGSGVDLFVVQPGMTTTDLFRKMVGCYLWRGW